MLTIAGLTVRYGRRTVIDRLDWRVGDPDALITVLLGPSGCGKSTLLRAIAGLEPVVEGAISFGGVDLAGTPVHKRDFGLVFQDGQLFAGKTVAQNIAYGLRRRGVGGRRPVAARVDELLELVQLPGFGSRQITELSGGQAQRVALARALAPRPRLLLLDEPLGALDQRLREDLAYAIGDVARATGTPTVVVTHDHTEAALIGDRVSVMRDGKIVQTDTPGRLWRAPRDEATAHFLGADLVIDGDSRGGRLDTALGAVTPSSAGTGDDGAWRISDGGHRLAIRADSLIAEPLGASDGVRAVVTHVAVLPEHLRVRVNTPLGELIALARVPVAVGDEVVLRLDPERIAVIGQ